MSLDRACDYLASCGLADRIILFDQSSATVELAARAVGCEPARIAKTLSFRIRDRVVLILLAGDVRIDNQKFKARFHAKPRMLEASCVEELVGHAVGGVCPFGVVEGVEVALDESLLRFDVVYPAAGTAASAVRVTPAELARALPDACWVDVSRQA